MGMGWRGCGRESERIGERRVRGRRRGRGRLGFWSRWCRGRGLRDGRGRARRIPWLSPNLARSDCAVGLLSGVMEPIGTGQGVEEGSPSAQVC